MALAWTMLAGFGGNPLVPSLAVLTSTLVLSRVLRAAARTGRDPLVLEIPPLRIPSAKNVLMETQMRLSDFFTHVVPLVVALNVGLRLLGAGFGVLGDGAEGSSGFSVLSTFLASSRSVLGIPLQAFIGVLLTILQRYFPLCSYFNNP